MEISELSSLTGIGLSILDRFALLRSETKNADINKEFYRKSVLLEINKNLQILNRIKDDFDYQNKENLSTILSVLDFTTLELVSYNLSIYSYVSNSNLLDIETDTTDLNPKSVYDLIVYVVTRIYLLRNYSKLSGMKGFVEVRSELLLKRITSSLVQISDLLKKER